MPQTLGAVLSHYRLVEKIGEGGTSEVWRALDTRLDREVAIKFLPESWARDAVRRARFESEARTIAALNHPNIVTIYTIEEAEGRHFFTMELVRGETLDRRIPEPGLELPELLALAIPLCAAVGAAHDRDVTHGDLKPRNVMIGETGLKVLDFGLATLRRPPPTAGIDAASLDTLTLEGRIFGTLPYMSPEHVQGRPVDPRSDVFALGILLYQMATGRRPFRGEAAADLIASILRDVPAAVDAIRPVLPRQLGRIIGRCLEKDASRRPPTARALVAQLQELAHEVRGSDAREVPSIAVLPFADISAEKDQDYFCEGIAEEIINALARIRDLHVVSRTSAFQFKGTALDSREIGDRLGARTLLEGSVRKAGDRLRITAELIDVADGYSLWSERYDRELADVFAIQEGIAQSIVQALRVTLSPRERRAMRQVATSDVRAYDYYLRGRKYFHQYRRRGIEFALQMFSRAIEIDPSYALAWAGIADCCSYLYMNAERVDAHRERADEASRRALALDPDLAEAHVARGVALSLGARHAEAEQAFETAIRLNPGLFEAHYFYARDCFTRGEALKAIGLYERAAEVRPEDYQSLLLLAQIHDDLGQPAEAEAARKRGVRVVEERLDQNPDDVRALYMGANGLVALGQREQGLAWAGRALAIEPDEPMLLYNLACIYGLAREVDRALDCLERAVERGFAHVGWIERDSNLDTLRGLPRFETLLARLRGAP